MCLATAKCAAVCRRTASTNIRDNIALFCTLKGRTQVGKLTFELKDWHCSACCCLLYCSFVKPYSPSDTDVFTKNLITFLLTYLLSYLLTYLLNYLITPCSRVLLEKLTVVSLSILLFSLCSFLSVIGFPLTCPTLYLCAYSNTLWQKTQTNLSNTIWTFFPHRCNTVQYTWYPKVSNTT